MQRGTESLAFPLRLERAQFRLADFVMAEIERCLLVVAFDRENFLEDRLQAGHFPLGSGHVFLQKVDVGIELNLNEVRGLNAFFDCSEVDTF